MNSVDIFVLCMRYFRTNLSFLLFWAICMTQYPCLLSGSKPGPAGVQNEFGLARLEHLCWDIPLSARFLTDSRYGDHAVWLRKSHRSLVSPKFFNITTWSSQSCSERKSFQIQLTVFSVCAPGREHRYSHHHPALKSHAATQSLPSHQSWNPRIHLPPAHH
jgi:hypothetical protein